MKNVCVSRPRVSSSIQLGAKLEAGNGIQIEDKFIWVTVCTRKVLIKYDFIVSFNIVIKHKIIEKQHQKTKFKTCYFQL